MKVSISIAEPFDVEAIAGLHARSWRETYAPWLPTDFVGDALLADRVRLWNSRFILPDSERDLILKATVDGNMVGFVCLTRSVDAVYGRLLGNLHIKADWKRHGIGRRLIAHAARAAMPSDAMHLWVLRGNSSARSFYEGLGGIETGARNEELVPGVIVDEVRYVWVAAALQSLAAFA